MRVVMVIAAMLAVTGASSAHAQPPDETREADPWAEPPPAWEGVWQGTIGKLPVHACLDATPFTQKGAYYYDRVKKLLRLEPAKQGIDWFEQESYDKNGARWSFSVRDAMLVGSWNDGKKKLPIELKRIGETSKDFEGPCGSMAFHRPRLASTRLSSRSAVKDGNRYTVWSFKPGPWIGDDLEVSTFTLDRPGSTIDKVNSLLRANLPKPDGTGEWLDCVAAGANSSGSDGDFAESIEPTLITDRWLSAKQSGGYYCGGAHPEDVSYFRTFDLTSGTEVNLLDWFLPTGVKIRHYDDGSEPAQTLTPGLVALILEGWKAEDPDCDEPVRSQEWWNVGIDRGSLVFSPILPRVIMACGEEFRVPFARLQPWLNQKGKAAVASLPR